MRIESCLARFPAIALLSVAGQGDQQHRMILVLLAQMLGYLKAVHSRHADVEQDHFGTELTSLLKRRQAVVGGMYIMTP